MVAGLVLATRIEASTEANLTSMRGCRDRLVRLEAGLAGIALRRDPKRDPPLTSATLRDRGVNAERLECPGGGTISVEFHTEDPLVPRPVCARHGDAIACGAAVARAEREAERARKGDAAEVAVRKALRDRRFGDALRMAETLDDLGVREDWFEEIALAAALQGDGVTSLAAARAFRDPSREDGVLGRIAANLVGTVATAEVVALADALRDPANRLITRLELATRLIERGAPLEARGLLSRASKEILPEDARPALARGLARSGDVGAALRLARSVRDPALSADLLPELVEQALATGDTGEVATTLDAMTDPRLKTLILLTAAAASAATGDRRRSGLYFQAATGAADLSRAAAGDRVALLAIEADRRAAVGDTKGASEVLARALALWKSLPGTLEARHLREALDRLEAALLGPGVSNDAGPKRAR